jgi:hypothetical protein
MKGKQGIREAYKLLHQTQRKEEKKRAYFSMSHLLNFLHFGHAGCGPWEWETFILPTAEQPYIRSSSSDLGTEISSHLPSPKIMPPTTRLHFSHISPSNLGQISWPCDL